MAYTLSQFIEKIKPYAIEDMKKNNILASLTISQAIIESNKGNSGLTTQANNLFGIKGSYNGQSVKMWTTEYRNGVKTRELADFKKYPSWQESLYDHSEFLRKYKRYASIIGDYDYNSVSKKIGASGYATEPNYGSIILNTIVKNKLYEIDNDVLKGIQSNRIEQVPLHIQKRRVLKRGMSGSDVVYLQKILQSQMYDIGATGADGIFGAKTEKALKQFQGERNLVVDGICGVKTWTMIEQYA